MVEVAKILIWRATDGDSRTLLAFARATFGRMPLQPFSVRHDLTAEMLSIALVTVMLLPAASSGDREALEVTAFLLRAKATPWPRPTIAPPERVLRNKRGEITHLRLDGMQFHKGDFAIIRGFAAIEHLSLAETNIRDADLRDVASLPALHGLSLDSTEIGDAGLAHLEACKGLRTLCLRSSSASPAAVEKLKQAIPELRLGYSRK